VEEGIIAGGGTSLIYAASAIDELKFNTHEEEVGAKMVKDALTKPAYQIAFNAGEEGAIVIEKIKNSKDIHFGYNAAKGEFEDLFKSGVIDPVKVVRSAVQNACSISGLFLTTEAVVTEIKKDEPAPAGMPGGMGGGMPGMY
jgi:chaperonin GroEL